MQVDEQQQPAPCKRKHVEHSDELRARIVQWRSTGLCWPAVAFLAGVPESSARGIVQVALEQGRTSKKQRGGNHNPVISDALKQLVCDLQAADNTLRLQDISNLIDAATLAPPPALSSIWNILQAAGFSTKQLNPHAAARNTLVMKEKRKEWVESVGASLQVDSAIFIDESPFNFCIVRGRGRNLKGQPAVTITPQIRGKNHSVIAAISPSLGLIHFEIKLTEPEEAFISKRKGSKKKKTGPKGVTRDVFRNFLIHLFATPPFQSASAPFTLLFDNAAIHKGDIADTIFQAGHVQQLLPAWSPELNPIEYAFSKWKLRFRALHADSEGAVDEAIKQAASSLTPADCKGYFEHTRTLYDKCSALEDI
jgi:transposase